jgi:hypothetical protein
MDKKDSLFLKLMKKGWPVLCGAVMVAVIVLVVILCKDTLGSSKPVIDLADNNTEIETAAEIDDIEDIDIDDGEVPLGGDPFGTLPTIRNFGAKGDGKTDDSKALKEYIKSGCTTLLFPKGTYNLGNAQIDLPSYISIVGESAETTVLKNININAPYGLSLTNLCCDGGTERTIRCAGTSRITGNVMFNVMPVGAQNVSYFSCIFRNCDYVSIAKHNISNSENKFMSNIVLDCKFYNIGRVAIYHILDIDYGYYARNSFDKIGSSSILSGELAAIKLGDTTTNSTCSLKEGLISNNTFSNLISGDDVENSKHSIACNFITVQGLKVVIDNNSFENLLGYGDDRESVYTKVRYLTVSNNTITNGGFGEGYICNKGARHADAYAEIINNTITGEYGIGIRNYGAGRIANNTINIFGARSAICCNKMEEGTSAKLTIENNTITVGNKMPIIAGSTPSTYQRGYIIQIESLNCPVEVLGNTVKTGTGDVKFKTSLRVGNVSNNVSICKNNIHNELSGGIEITAGTALEASNKNISVAVNENKLECYGQLVNITFKHSAALASTRQFTVKNNTLTPLSSTKYGIIISSGTGNNDSLVFEGTTSAKLFTSNVVYANVPNVEKNTK